MFVLALLARYVIVRALKYQSGPKTVKADLGWGEVLDRKYTVKKNWHVSTTWRRSGGCSSSTSRRMEFPLHVGQRLHGDGQYYTVATAEVRDVLGAHRLNLAQYDRQDAMARAVPEGKL